MRQRQRWAVTICAGLLGTAWAADPVIYFNENPNIALGRVLTATGVLPENLRSVTISELVEAHGPTLLGPGTIKGCAGAPTTMAQVKDLVEEGDRSLAYLEFEPANAALNRANNVLGCLTEPLDAETVARLFYLRGLIAYENGDRATTWDEYFRAHTYHPTMAWDDNFTPDSQSIFKLAAGEYASAERVTLSLSPPLPAGDLLIDGHPVEDATQAVELHPGEHVVQARVGGRFESQVVTIQAGAAPTLVMPRAVPGDAVVWPVEDHMRPALSAVLSVVAKQGQAIYVTALGGVWKTVAGEEGWEELMEPSITEPMVLTGVPEGATVSYAPTEGGSQNRRTAPWEEGELDPVTGLRISAGLSLGVLPEGSYTYRVEHRLLGATGGVFEVRKNKGLTHAVDLSEVPGHDALRMAYQTHVSALDAHEQAQRFDRKSQHGAALSAGLFTVGTLAALSSLKFGGEAADAKVLEDEASLVGDADLAAQYFATRTAAEEAAGGRLLGAVAAYGFTGIGAAVTVKLRKKGAPAREPAPEWSPATLTLEEPASDPQPAENAQGEGTPGDGEDNPSEEAPAQTEEEAPSSEE